MSGRVAVLIAGLFAVLIAGCTTAGTPRRSLDELRSALLAHDAETALRYIDVDSVVESIMRDKFLQLEAKAENPVEALGIRVGREVATLARPAVSALVERQVKRAIASDDQWGYFDDIRRASVWYLDVSVTGDVAVVKPKGKSDVRFHMTRREQGVWQITEIARK